MTDNDDREYFAERALLERHMSRTSPDPNVALIHQQLADRYEKIASELTGRPKLGIVARN